MGKNYRDKQKGSQNYWQSRDFNDTAVDIYTSDLVRLAMNRFAWEGLPDSVNVKYLEWCLLTNGYATIAHPDNEALSDNWMGLQVSTLGDLNAYGEPTEWQALGANGKTWFDVQDGKNGVLIFNSNQFVNNFYPAYDSTWQMIRFMARKLAHYELVENSNLAMQQTAWFLSCSQEKKLDATNLFKNICGYEPAVIASPTFRDEVGIDVIKTDVPFIGEQLFSGKRNILNQAYTYLGIPHLDFEKSERMITSEAENVNSPTYLRMMDALAPRQRAAKALSKLIGNEVVVKFNQPDTSKCEDKAGGEEYFGEIE